MAGLLGIPLTGLAGFGLAVAGRRRQWGLWLWFAVSAASALVNPLPWQRYYLPLVPVATLLAGVGIHFVARWTAANLPSFARSARTT